MEEKKVIEEFCIVVLKRGFIYVGEATHDGQWCVIRNAKNVRYWGTINGLGELANNGPTDKTKLDVVGTIRAPASSVIHLIDTKASKWNC